MYDIKIQDPLVGLNVDRTNSSLDYVYDMLDAMALRPLSILKKVKNNGSCSMTIHRRNPVTREPYKVFVEVKKHVH